MNELNRLLKVDDRIIRYTILRRPDTEQVPFLSDALLTGKKKIFFFSLLQRRMSQQRSGFRMSTSLLLSIR